jgi:hypothetical protein
MICLLTFRFYGVLPDDLFFFAAKKAILGPGKGKMALSHSILTRFE